MILDEQEIVFMKCPFCNKETESPMIVPDYCESCGTVYILSEDDLAELWPFIMEELNVDIRDYYYGEAWYNPELKEITEDGIAMLQYFSPYPKGSSSLIGLV
jgi:hypothetical protein